jgi:hypothetical protein
MDLRYPDGTIILCIRFGDLGRNPISGDRVVCVRRNRQGLVEATVKEFVIDDDGQPWLWPRSTHPEHQTPLALPKIFQVSDDAEDFAGVVHASFEGDEQEFEILARVTGVYSQE